MTEHRSIGKQISIISRSLAAIVDRKVTHLGLTSTTIPIITFLFENDGVHQEALAAALRFDKSTAARAVSRLEKRGYITKAADPDNRRRNIIRSTPEARAIQPELSAILKTITDDLFITFRENEIDRYFSLTRKILDRTKAMLQEKEDR